MYVANVHKCHYFLYRDFIADHLEDEEDEEDEEGGASRWDDRSTIRPAHGNWKYLPFYWHDIAVFKISIIGGSFIDLFRSVLNQKHNKSVKILSLKLKNPVPNGG